MAKARRNCEGSPRLRLTRIMTLTVGQRGGIRYVADAMPATIVIYMNHQTDVRAAQWLIRLVSDIQSWIPALCFTTRYLAVVTPPLTCSERPHPEDHVVSVGCHQTERRRVQVRR